MHTVPDQETKYLYLSMEFLSISRRNDDEKNLVTGSLAEMLPDSLPASKGGLTGSKIMLCYTYH